MRQWNKETINEQLKLHKKQNKDKRYNYFSREFNSLWYCWELEKYTISLQNQLQQKDKEIERLNNIINELEKDFESYELEYLQETYQGSLADFIETELKRIQELKGSDKE